MIRALALAIALLPPLLSAEHVAGERLWSIAGQAPLVVTAIEGADLVVGTDAGPVLVPAALADRDAGAMAGAFHDLVARAGAAGVRSGEGEARLRFADATLTGLRLRGPGDALVVAEGVLVAQPTPDDRRPGRRADLAGAARALAAALPRSHAHATAAKALGELLEDIARERGEGDGEVLPVTIRRALRPEVLAAALGPLPELDAYARALADAERVETVREWRGDGLSLRQVGDACGDGGWIYRTPTRCRVLARPRPVSGWSALDAALAACQLVIELPPDADPLDARGAALDRAAVRLDDAQGRELARWDPRGGFVADEAAWKAAFAAQLAELADPVIADRWPAHLPVHGVDGAFLRLITAHGALDAPTPAADDAERFIAQAATALPDQAHLDLLDTYAFAYANDSPDPAQPRLIGAKSVMGDIHQTSAQTLATAVQGVCRGDCDDLAELYQAILVRQGRLAHVVALPSHLAAAWVEHDGDEWRARVLQTGPALAFTADSCAGALELLYKHFSPDAPFDASQVSVALRFAGENTRSQWVLGERIFRDADYARTMIDVERDWYFRTYARAIAKMRALVAAGDGDIANHSELEGLYARTGRWRQAYDEGRLALPQATDRAGRLLRLRRLLGHLVALGARDEAAMVVREARGLMPGRDGKDSDQLAQQRARLALSVAASLPDDDYRDQVLALLREDALPWVMGMLPSVEKWLDAHPGRTLPDDRWTREFLSLGGWCVSEALGVCRGLRDRGEPAPDDLLRFCDRWLTRIAFAASGEDADALDRYATIGWWMAQRDGDAATLTRLAATPAPLTPPPTGPRAPLAEQADRDAPWVAIAPSFWQFALSMDLSRAWRRHELDADAVARDCAAIDRAADADAALGLISPRIELDQDYARLVRALVERDEAALRALLRKTRAYDDRRRWESVASTIGSLARWMPRDWFATVLTAWREEADAKPFWFEIAWSAARDEAPVAARMTAAAAVARYPDDTAFAEERRSIDQLLDERPDPDVVP